jgi:4-amino-4-deoxy-L-arabinose transferase-like glycosyltransferase
MLSKIYSFKSIWQRLKIWGAFPYLSLLIWILPLLLFNSGQSSLMAHDEGLYAWRARQMLESGDWIHPWSNPHHKTPGPYWLIASSYSLFGISEASVRLPSMITGVLSILLLYEIGKILLGKQVAWLAAAILSVEFLFLQYCRLGTPDVPMIFLVLLAICSLLKAELHPKYRYVWCFVAGFSFGLGFLVRSLMIFLPIIALFPYLIWEHRRHHHLTNPMLYLGFIVGLIPTLIWLWLSILHYGNGSFEELFRFAFRLGTSERGGNGILFYLWNVPIKAFPWFFFSILGLVLAIRRPIARYQLILIGYPLTLFVELSLVSTRLPHYSLSLYPFIALLAALGLDWLSQIYTSSVSLSSLPRNLSYAFGVLGILLLLISIFADAIGDVQVRQYGTLLIALGVGWLILPIVWISRYRFSKRFLTARYWMAGWLIPAWLTLAVAGINGFLSDYNPDVKAFKQQPAIFQILHSSPIYFVDVGGKTGVLLNFYTPHHQSRVDDVSELPAFSYAWVRASQAANVSTPHRVLGGVQNYKLIQVLKQESAVSSQ